jgi:hypothetical protein
MSLNDYIQSFVSSSLFPIVSLLGVLIGIYGIFALYRFVTSALDDKSTKRGYTAMHFDNQIRSSKQASRDTHNDQMYHRSRFHHRGY